MTDAFVDLSIHVDASPETVWNIITTPELFSGWMDGTVTFESSIGSPFRAHFPNFQTVVAGLVAAFDADLRQDSKLDQGRRGGAASPHEGRIRHPT